MNTRKPNGRALAVRVFSLLAVLLSLLCFSAFALRDSEPESEKETPPAEEPAPTPSPETETEEPPAETESPKELQPTPEPTAEPKPTFEHLNYQKTHFNDAWIYRYPGSDRLVVWFTGGGHKPTSDKSLGELLRKGKLKPKCNVLCPLTGGSGPSPKEMRELIEYACPEAKHLSIVGYSLGSDRAANLVSKAPAMFERVCLIANYNQKLDKKAGELNSDVVILIGYYTDNNYLPYKIQLRYDRVALYQVKPYRHEIGEQIWQDKRFDVLGWLSGETDEIFVGDPSLLKADGVRSWIVRKAS